MNIAVGNIVEDRLFDLQTVACQEMSEHIFRIEGERAKVIPFFGQGRILEFLDGFHITAQAAQILSNMFRHGRSASTIRLNSSQYVDGLVMPAFGRKRACAPVGDLTAFVRVAARGGAIEHIVQSFPVALAEEFAAIVMDFHHNLAQTALPPHAALTKPRALFKSAKLKSNFSSCQRSDPSNRISRFSVRDQ